MPDAVGYDPLTHTGHVTFTWDGKGSVCECTVTGVAAIQNRQPERLSSIFHAIDPDALESLFVRASDEDRRNEGAVPFRYEGCGITVYATGVIEIDASDLDVDSAQSRS